MRPDIPEAHIEYLLDGDYGSDMDKFLFAGDREAVRSAWEAVRDEMLLAFVRESPGTRPWAWWEFDAPGRRARLDGGKDGEDKGMAFKLGVPDFAYRHSYGPYATGGSFSFESQAAFLRRCELLLPGEERKIPAAAFAPEVIA